ncbi:hypothetical protein HYT26_04955 [Candidatus Pacearchaeota archaeon]|nr:hypothetical protein [Candidatus Pacearchaeota archaeon]
MKRYFKEKEEKEMTRAFDFIRSALGVKVTNMKKALAIGKNIIIGKNFVFQQGSCAKGLSKMGQGQIVNKRSRG